MGAGLLNLVKKMGGGGLFYFSLKRPDNHLY